MKKFKQGFFEFISAASNEKVHSQTLAWIFSKNCTAFTAEVKGELLCELVGDCKDDPQNYIPLKSIAEIEDIDLFIECANVCLIIENKIINIVKIVFVFFMIILKVCTEYSF